VSALPVRDPGASRAVLVAVDDYPAATAPGPLPTPGPARNAERLRALLTDPARLGLAPEHCTVLRNPPDAAAVLDVVYEAAAEATGAFILYVAGFALATPRHPDLYFALAGSSESRLYRALRYPDLAAVVRDTGKAADRVVLLDYCYDGEVPPIHGAGAGGSADLEAVAGACVLAATAPDAAAWVPQGEELTAFTGALVRAVEAGPAEAGDELELAALHHLVGRDLAARGLPAPRLWPAHGERPIALVRNVPEGAETAETAEDAAPGERERATEDEVDDAPEASQDPEIMYTDTDTDADIDTEAAPAAERAYSPAAEPRANSSADPPADAADDEPNTLPRVPEGQAPALAMTPSDLAEWIARLRASGWPQVADDVLDGAAGHLHPANAGLLAVVLRMAGREAEADRTLAVLGQRPAGQCADALLSLVRAGYREDCERLAAEAGRRPAERVHRLLRALAGRGGAAQAALVLAEATGHAPAGAAVEPYAEALPLLGGPREAGALLAESVAHWPEGRVLTLAEELEEAGYGLTAFPLYARAAALAAGNWPPDRFALLLRRMSEAGAAPEAVDAMLTAAEKAVGPYPSLTAYLATDLVHAKVVHLAVRLLERAVPAYSDVELVALSSYLEAGRQRALAVHAYATAALNRPPSATVGYIDVLRRHGTPAHADELVTGVLAGRPAHVVGLIGALRSAGRTADVDRVLTLATQGPCALAGAVARELAEAGAEQEAGYVLDGIAARPLPELASALAALAESDPAQAVRLDPYLRDRVPQEFIDAVAVLRAAGSDREAEQLFAALGRGGPGQVCAAAITLQQSGRARDAADLLDGFAAQAPAEDAVEAMALLAETRGGAQAAGELLTAALATRPDPALVLAALRRVRDPVQTDRYLEHLGTTLPVADLVVLASNLSMHGCEGEADLMLTRAAGRDDFEELRAAFHDAGRHAQAYHLTERRGETRPG
jgi:hypothetical protein